MRWRSEKGQQRHALLQLISCGQCYAGGPRCEMEPRERESEGTRFREDTRISDTKCGVDTVETLN